MPVVRHTVTTTRTTSGGGYTTSSSFHRIPLWTIKLVTTILSTIILVCVFLQPKGIWQYHVMTFLIVVLTCGFILGWSLPSVLSDFLPLHNVNKLIYTFMAVLTVLSAIVCTVYLIDNNDRYSRTDEYKMFLGIGICFIAEAVIFCILAFWICFGSYAIVETR